MPTRDDALEDRIDQIEQARAEQLSDRELDGLAADEHVRTER
jgi:hypothetical protein